MKSIIALSALIAAALATPDNWAFTWSGSDAKGEWTSTTAAAATTTASTVATITSASASAGSSSVWQGHKGGWTSCTSYTATYSSGSSTWAVPTQVSYTISDNWTSMLPPAVSSPASPSVVPAKAETTVAPVVSSYSATTPAAATYTGGAAAAAVNMAGVGAVAFAGLAMVL
jgi:hypothetical protein